MSSKSKTQLKATINAAFAALEYAVDRSVWDARKIFDELVRAERHQEAGHRRMAPEGVAPNKFGAETIVKYFVVRSVCAVVPAPKSWAEYAGYNTRTKLGQELKATFATRSKEAGVDFHGDEHVRAMLKIDYLTDLVEGEQSRRAPE